MPIVSVPQPEALGWVHSLNCQWQVELRSAGVDQAEEQGAAVFKDKHVLTAVIG